MVNQNFELHCLSGIEGAAVDENRGICLLVRGLICNSLTCEAALRSLAEGPVGVAERENEAVPVPVVGESVSKILGQVSESFLEGEILDFGDDLSLLSRRVMSALRTGSPLLALAT